MEIEVFADQAWQDTGISIEAGDRVEIEYVSGEWTTWSGTIAPHDASGEPDGYVCGESMPASECAEPVPEAVKGSLVARIGDAQPVYVGNHSTFVAEAAGPLELATNDALGPGDLADNEGSIVVRITVTTDR